MQEFEKAFDDFIDSYRCEQEANAIYDLIRSAFAAGYYAAGGAPSQIDNLIRLEIPEGLKEKT